MGVPPMLAKRGKYQPSTYLAAIEQAQIRDRHLPLGVHDYQTLQRLLPMQLRSVTRIPLDVHLTLQHIGHRWNRPTLDRPFERARWS